MTTSKDFLERVYQLNDDFKFVSLNQEPATLELINKYSSEKNIKFNDDLVEFLTTFGAVILEVGEDVWQRPQVGQINDMWRFGYGFFIYGLSPSKDFPSWLSFEEKYDETEFKGDKSIGQLFFKRSGNLYRAYINDDKITLEYDRYGDDREIYSGNLYDFLIEEINNLERDYLAFIKDSDT